MNLVVEIRATVRRSGRPNLVPLAEVDKHHGFRSIVAYDENVAALIREQGGTSHLRGMPVYADTLFIDFDGHDPTEFRAYLTGTDLAYEEYDSGNRSVHFHIPLVPVFSVWVTDAMRTWVKRHAPTADISFYHPAGQYRLPGTYHFKRPGRCKMLTAVRMGEPLVLSQPERVTQIQYVITDEERREVFYQLLTQAKGEGHRRPHMWLLSTTAAEAGFDFAEALEHIRWWNDRFCEPPHDDDVLQRQCESAYRRLARRQE